MLKTKAKRILSALILFFLFLSSGSALAAGLVPCGGEGEDACTLSDFFTMVSNVVDFILYKVIPPIAVITIVFAAINLMTSSGNPEKMTQAKKTIIWIIVGLVVAYGAWTLITGFVDILGGNSGWTLQFFQ